MQRSRCCVQGLRLLWVAFLEAGRPTHAFCTERRNGEAHIEQQKQHLKVNHNTATLNLKKRNSPTGSYRILPVFFCCKMCSFRHQAVTQATLHELPRLQCKLVSFGPAELAKDSSSSQTSSDQRWPSTLLLVDPAPLSSV